MNRTYVNDLTGAGEAHSWEQAMLVDQSVCYWFWFGFSFSVNEEFFILFCFCFFETGFLCVALAVLELTL